MIVGVNRYQVEDDEPQRILRLDPERERAQVARLGRFKAARDRERVRAALSRVEDAAATSENLMPRVLDAVEARATLGEIADALGTVFGVYREQVIV